MQALTRGAKDPLDYGVFVCAYASNSPKKGERSQDLNTQADRGFWGMNIARGQVALLPGDNSFYIGAAARTG